jgi:FAD/FMN-containing dehydrogenase
MDHVVTRSFGDLSARIHGRLLLPGDNGYDGARAVWNAMVDKRPALIIQCADAEDVRTAIRFGREARLELGVRCGGHSITGQSVPDGGLMIDLTPMNAVRIDSDRHLGYVQGGALLRNLDVASHEHALATTAGNVSHTGVGGLTLGGGMGWLARQIGLACDNVVTFQLVTADGETLIASEAQDPDLYWGLRGGGGNFGVVTEFTFRLHPTTGRALSVDLFFAPEDGPQVIGGWRDLVREAPRQATATAWAGTAPDWPFLPTELRGTDLVSAGFVWVGDPEEGRKLIPAYRALGKTVAEAIDETSYLELQSSADEANRHGRRRYWKDLYFTEFSDEAVAAFVSRGGTADDGQFRAYGGFQAYGGAISEVGADETA